MLTNAKIPSITSILFVLLSALPHIATAEPSEGKLTLQAAIERALENNKELSATNHEIEAMKAAMTQAGTRPNPEISVLMEDTRKSTRAMTYQLNVPIELGGKRGARLGVAQGAYERAVLALSEKQAEIRAGVTKAYFDTLIALEKQQLAQDLLQLTERTTEITARRVSAGKLSPVEETKAQVANANARLFLNQAKSDVTLANKRLAAYWGELDSRAQLATDSVDTLPTLPDVAQLIDRVMVGPATQLAKSDILQRQAQARLERTKRFPDPTISFGQQREEESRRNRWIIGLSLPIPLFDRNQGNLREALTRVDQARDVQAATALRLQGDAAQSHEQMRLGEQEVAALRRDIIPSAQSAYAAAVTGFESGKFSFLEVLDAQRTYFEAQSQYWQAIAKVHQAWAELTRLMGQP